MTRCQSHKYCCLCCPIFSSEINKFSIMFTRQLLQVLAYLQQNPHGWSCSKELLRMLISGLVLGEFWKWSLWLVWAPLSRAWMIVGQSKIFSHPKPFSFWYNTQTSLDPLFAGKVSTLCQEGNFKALFSGPHHRARGGSDVRLSFPSLQLWTPQKTACGPSHHMYIQHPKR